MIDQPQSTAPTVNTDLMRKLAMDVEATHIDDSALILEAAAAIDTLRKHFTAQQTYIQQLNRRLGTAASR